MGGEEGSEGMSLLGCVYEKRRGKGGRGARHVVDADEGQVEGSGEGFGSVGRDAQTAGDACESDERGRAEGRLALAYLDRG